MTDMTLAERTLQAQAIAAEGGALALDWFRRRDRLAIDLKGPQDFVTEADKATELAIRAGLADAFPDDGIIGEEHPPKPGDSGFTWVIDPIDGTANFVTGIPFWCVALAGVSGGRVQVAVIHDALHGESFTAHRQGGAMLNGAAMRMPAEAEIGSGTVSIGFSRRTPAEGVAQLVRGIREAGGVWSRTGSGALSLAHTAAGRYLGYAEAHMNAWDCLAGQLLVEEAGGTVEPYDADAFLRQGGRVIVAAPRVYPRLLEIAESAFRG